MEINYKFAFISVARPTSAVETMQCIGAILCAVAVLHWAGPSVGANSAPEVHLGNQQDRQIIEKGYKKTNNRKQHYSYIIVSKTY